MGVEVKIDMENLINQAVEITKNREVIEVKCPTCGEIIGKYSYNFLEKKRILLCKNCKDKTKIDINFHVKGC